MKITEIIISDELKTFEYLKDERLTKRIYDIFYEARQLTSNFTQENYEIFNNYQDILDFRIEIDYLQTISSEIYHSEDQVIKVLKFLTDCFER